VTATRSLTIRLGDWATLGTDAAAIRREVFIDEQHIPESEEWDDGDAVSIHAVAYDSGGAIATGRLLPDARIGRMAVRRPHRRSGIGGMLLDALIDAARARGDGSVVLSAQTYVIDFYARHGFVTRGEPYDDCGIPHQTMHRALR
jgi:predicted GNAT family N-acyltransferase